MINLNINKITSDFVEKIYKEKVLGIECRTYFEHYYQRLSLYYTPDEQKLAKNILKSLSLSEGMSKKELVNIYIATLKGKKFDEHEFTNLLSDLENDFYIEFYEKKEVYRFKTKVLKDWWKKYYGFFENGG